MQDMISVVKGVISLAEKNNIALEFTTLEIVNAFQRALEWVEPKSENFKFIISLARQKHVPLDLPSS